MRHLTGIVLAIVMTAALFCAATWGYVRFLAQSSRLPAGASLLSDHHALFALGALAGTGLLAGILIAAPRISPLAAGLPGLLLLGLSVLYLVSVRRADELIPLRSHVFGAGLRDPAGPWPAGRGRAGDDRPVVRAIPVAEPAERCAGRRVRADREPRTANWPGWCLGSAACRCRGRPPVPLTPRRRRRRVSRLPGRRCPVRPGVTH